MIDGYVSVRHVSRESSHPIRPPHLRVANGGGRRLCACRKYLGFVVFYTCGPRREEKRWICERRNNFVVLISTSRTSALASRCGRGGVGKHVFCWRSRTEPNRTRKEEDGVIVSPINS